MTHRLLVAVGTRPEFVKIAPVVQAIAAQDLDIHLVATGQHFDHRMAGQFLADLDLAVDESWELGDTTGGGRLGLLLSNAFEAIDRVRPDAVLVLGDTVTVPVFALAARALTVPLIHVEAGLRSYNEQSVEEANRRIAASVASLHFAPTERARRVLLREGVADERIQVTGNPAIDALRLHGPVRVPLADRRGAVLTAHRPTNVDDPVRLREVVAITRDLAERAGGVDFPVHPRTRARLEEAGLWSDLASDASVRLTGPVAYARMLELVAGSRLVVTDSGGLQEEAAWLGVPAVVMRRSTPRWEGVELGISILSGTSRDEVHRAADTLMDPATAQHVDAVPCPYGDGHASERIAARLADESTWRLLELQEPDYRDRSVPEP